MILDILFLGGLAFCLALISVLLCRSKYSAGGYILIIGFGIFCLGLQLVSKFPFLIDVKHHNFFYTALGYAAGRGFPPENPFAAGMPASFPWLTFFLYTQISHILGLSPGVVAKIVGILCSGIAVTSVVTMVSAWDSQRQSMSAVKVGAVVMVFFAGTIFWGSFPKIGINPIGHPLAGGWWESRGLPVITCFQNFTFPIGLGAALFGYAAFILSLVKGNSFLRNFLIFLGTAFSAFYPFAWLALGLSVAGASIAALLRHVHHKVLFTSLIFCGIGAALAYFYISSLRPEGACPPFAVDLDFGQLVLEGRLIIFYQSILCLACLVNLKFFVKEWKSGQTFPFLLLGSVLAINLATLGIRFLDHTDYKLWVFAAIFLGVLAAPSFTSAVRQFPVWTVLILTILLLPLSRTIWQDTLGVRRIEPPLKIASDEGQLKIVDKNLQEPYTWISENTPKDSVVIEQSYTWAPIFANRSIFIGSHKERTKLELFGFLTPVEVWLSEFCGFGDVFVKRRLDLVEELFSGAPSDECINTICSEVPGRSVFVLLRFARIEGKLHLNNFDSRFVVAASGDTWKLYRIAPMF